MGELAQDQEGSSRFNFFYLCTCSLVELPYVSCFSVFSVCFFLIEYVLPCQYSMDFLGRFVNWTPGEGVQFRGVFDYGLAIALHSFHVFGPRPVLYAVIINSLKLRRVHKRVFVFFASEFIKFARVLVQLWLGHHFLNCEVTSQLFTHTRRVLLERSPSMTGAFPPSFARLRHL